MQRSVVQEKPQTTNKKPSVGKSVLPKTPIQQTPQAPKGLKSAFGKSAKTSARSFGKILNIEELLDLDIRRFERENNLKIKNTFHNLESSGKKVTTKTSTAQKASRGPSTSHYKKKVSDNILEIGLKKRLPVKDEQAAARELKRKEWEQLNMKKDHLKKFMSKPKDLRVI